MAHAIRFEEVSKRYLRGGPRHRSFRYDVARVGKRLAGVLSGKASEPTGTLALDRVSFEIGEGESWAIVGPNGSGKTTALKLISRISVPTGGRLSVRGRVGALIEVGYGIHPELSARENIWLYGQILGMNKSDVARRFDEIVDFAEVGDALDRQVKMYSSGMQLRLGFSIASHVDPDILVVDEALAVGDAAFQAKCVQRMSHLVSEGRTLLFVSHNLSAVEAVCDRAFFLLDGRMAHMGPTEETIRAYLRWVDTSQRERLSDPEGHGLILERVTCHGEDGEERYAFTTGEDMEVRLHLRADEPLEHPAVSLGIGDGRPGTLALCSMLADGAVPPAAEGAFVVSCRLRDLPLLPRVYELWCSVQTPGRHDLIGWRSVGSFRIAEGADGGMRSRHASTHGPLHLDHEWRVGSAR